MLAGAGQVLLETLYLSLDPYMYGRMVGNQSYAKAASLGAPIPGEAICRVLQSTSSEFEPGEMVSSHSGWQTHSIANANELRRLPADDLPLTVFLGILGMPGFTAYGGLRMIGKPAQGETLAVAAATGPVGAAVSQIARNWGAKVIGIAGGSEKVNLLKELGVDHAVDHRAQNFEGMLARVADEGIDIYFENVGARTWRAVLPLLNDHARVPVCGTVGDYNGTSVDSPRGFGEEIMRTILQKRLLVQGFVVRELGPELRAEFEREMINWIRAGKVTYFEDIFDDFERTPEIFVDMLKGRNTGKTIVQLTGTHY